jgi:selenocysteine lyase/cysteine desulfurase
VRVVTDVTYFRTLRAEEFGRLDRQGVAYLDYTGGGLPAARQVNRHHDFMSEALLGNPHSENPPALASTELINRARTRVLDFLDADPHEYCVVFTSNATGALKLVGEGFPFRPGSVFARSADNHNSVNGIREFATARGADVYTLGLDDELRLSDPMRLPFRPDGPSLFSFPAQSNFSGVRHPLGLVEEAQAAGYRVCLDAAAFVPTARLSLRAVPADFVCLSFYKIFGYPTGIGALVARCDALNELERPWFAGGTVAFASSEHPVRRLLAGPEAFEDGTPNFQAAPALLDGFDLIEEVDLDRLARRVATLTERMLKRLSELRRPNGGPAVEIYGPPSMRDRGGTVAFNVIGPGGSVVPYDLVERMAAHDGISIRGGCFCNPGASEAALDVPVESGTRCLEDLMEGPFNPGLLSQCLGGSPVGAVRASLGMATSERDIDRLIEFVGRLGARRAARRASREDLEAYPTGTGATIDVPGSPALGGVHGAEG